MNAALVSKNPSGSVGVAALAVSAVAGAIVNVFGSEHSTSAPASAPPASSATMCGSVAEFCHEFVPSWFAN